MASNNKIEKLFVSCLRERWKLEYFLREKIDLLSYMKTKPAWPVIDLTFSFIPKNKKIEMFRDISTNRILLLLQQERPDIYNVFIKNPNSIAWLEKQIIRFKEFFNK